MQFCDLQNEEAFLAHPFFVRKHNSIEKIQRNSGVRSYTIYIGNPKDGLVHSKSFVELEEDVNPLEFISVTEFNMSS